MNKLTNFKKRNIVTGLLFMILCSILMLFFLGVNFGEWVLFLVFNTITIYIPGCAFFCFIDIKLTTIKRMMFSYSIGYALLIPQYFLVKVLGGAYTIYVVQIIVIALSTWYILKKRNFVDESEDKEYVESIFLAMVVVFNVFAYAARYLDSPNSENIYINHDMQYWLNNIAALKISWPAENLFFVGEQLNYHYFSSIPLAFISELYGWDIYYLAFSMYAIMKPIIIVGATSFFIDAFRCSKKVKILVLILLLFTTGAERISRVCIYEFLIQKPCGFDIGYAYAMFFLALIIRQWQSSKFLGRNLVGTILIWWMCVGAKAPIASVIILFAALVCFYWLITKRFVLAFGYGGTILASFLLIGKFCVGLFSVVSGDTTWKMTLYSAERIKNVYDPESWDVLGCLLASVSRQNVVLAVVLRIISVNPCIIFLMIVSVYSVARRYVKKQSTLRDLYLMGAFLFTSIFGLLLGVFVNACRLAESYFSIAAILTMIGSILWSSELFGGWSREKQSGKKEKIMIALVSCILISGVYRFSFSTMYGDGIIVDTVKGIKNLVAGENHGIGNSGDIKKETAITLGWIADNTPIDSLVMVDRAVVCDDLEYYMYGIFCERQMYIEGTDMMDIYNVNLSKEVERRRNIVRGVYGNDLESLKIAIEEGVDYIVQTRDLTSDLEYDEDYLQCVVETDDIKIYEVK